MTATNPVLGSNVPGRAERDRASLLSEKADTLVREVSLALSWLMRNANEGQDGPLTMIRRAVEAMNAQDSVYVLRVEPCECRADESEPVVHWLPTEAERDRERDFLLFDDRGKKVVEPGDTVSSYRLLLPNSLGQMTDDEVSALVEEAGSALVEDVVRYRFAACMTCGRTDFPPSPEDSLARIATLFFDQEVGYDEMEAGMRRLLGAAGFFPPDEEEAEVLTVSFNRAEDSDAEKVPPFDPLVDIPEDALAWDVLGDL